MDIIVFHPNSLLLIAIHLKLQLISMKKTRRMQIVIQITLSSGHWFLKEQMWQFTMQGQSGSNKQKLDKTTWKAMLLRTIWLDTAKNQQKKNKPTCSSSWAGSIEGEKNTYVMQWTLKQKPWLLQQSRFCGSLQGPALPARVYSLLRQNSFEVFASGNTKQIFKVYPVVNNCRRGVKGQR